MKKIRIILFLFYGMLFSQNNICESNDYEPISIYSIFNASALNKDDIRILKLIEQSITNKELENLSILEEDQGFRKIAERNCREPDFRFLTVEDMFKYLEVAVSEKYGLTKSQLDKFFAEEKLLDKFKVGKIGFFHFDKSFGCEIYLYDYVYCKNNKYLDYYALSNSMLLSTNNPYDNDDICDQNLIRFEDTKNFKRYIIPITNEKECFYMSVYFIKAATFP